MSGSTGGIVHPKLLNPTGGRHPLNAFRHFDRGESRASRLPRFRDRPSRAWTESAQDVPCARKEKSNHERALHRLALILPHDRFALPRYRVCLHSAGSDETRRFAFTNSAEEAVLDFLRHGPLFKAVLDQAGVRNELHWLEGRVHATVLLFGGDAEDAAIDFLDRILRK